jgi:hypothetical protein
MVLPLLVLSINIHANLLPLMPISNNLLCLLLLMPIDTIIMVLPLLVLNINIHANLPLLMLIITTVSIDHQPL